MLRSIQHLNCLLIKPVGPQCNLRCDYCFYLDKMPLFSNPTTMSSKILEATIRKSLEQGTQPFSFIWQGGEPLLAGLDFFKETISLQKKYSQGRSISNAIQTNGTLLNDEWADFFLQNDFLVGVSLDGPETIHNNYRKGINGETTWNRVLAGAKLCQAKGVATNILSCVTAESVKRPIELYQFYKQEGFKYLQFIPVVELDKEQKLTDYSVPGKAYGNFLIKLFDHWLADFKNGQPTTSIRFFDTLFFTLLGHKAPECGLHRQCGGYLTVEHTGEMFPCDFFVEPVHSRGNILHQNPHGVFNSKLQRLFGGAKENVPNICSKCKVRDLCHGGCLKDRKNNPRDPKTNYFCRAMKDFLPHALPYLTQLKSQWRG